MFRRVIFATAASSPLLISSFVSSIHADSGSSQQLDTKTSSVDAISPTPLEIKLPSPAQYNATGDLIIDDETNEDEEAWNIKQEQCSFCKSFLMSPCKDQFKKWSKCVEKSKDLDIDFVKACKMYTESLLICSSENSDYFEKLEAAVDDEPSNEVITGIIITDKSSFMSKLLLISFFLFANVLIEVDDELLQKMKSECHYNCHHYYCFTTVVIIIINIIILITSLDNVPAEAENEIIRNNESLDETIEQSSKISDELVAKIEV